MKRFFGAYPKICARAANELFCVFNNPRIYPKVSAIPLFSGQLISSRGDTATNAE